ncbi:MBL fold metallo-hydrolase [Luteolibacter ambystomatis]|uniref:MBL fold metallo-hydrolase n=1 Tax=Luteolibacter ambystomatis TaxID=2824561 RepID=A0A975J2C6_9BACT|nr:MBL fold metallo-hydrolase [Luteolibacter ambystomatis]QUE52770.1 MBL fold metallo-hydrolase [Luteolibacter ambystomatis]
MLLEHDSGLVLVDTGIGLEDIAHPVERIGSSAINAAGFQFHEPLTAIRQIERLGFRAADVTDIILTHGDHDHVGGLADFPNANVHISEEEHFQLGIDHRRYSSAQFAHRPRWITHPTSSERWFGLEARSLDLFNGISIHLIPLFGHTLGHCGVAIQDGDRWLLHAGDAYYLRVELSTDNHPVSTLATQRADDDDLRRASLSELRRLAQKHAPEIEIFGYHDFTEFPSEAAISVE